MSRRQTAIPCAKTYIVFSLDCISIGPVFRISMGYQDDILEQFEISKMAAKMADDGNRK